MTDIAKRIVAEWLVELWIKRPDWLTRMPSQEDTQSLIDRIAKEIGCNNS